jgi:hypothetical protein
MISYLQTKREKIDKNIFFIILNKKYRMGNESSKQENLIKQQKLQEEALRKFNIRVSTYSYPHHGQHNAYIEWCRAQYELECLPESCRQGSNFNPRDNYW